MGFWRDLGRRLAGRGTLSGVPHSWPVAEQVAQRRALASTRATEAAVKEMTLGPQGTIVDPDGEQYRQVTGGTGRLTTRDLTPVQQDRMLQIVWWLYETNPFARRIVEMMRDLVIGDGVVLRAKDPVVNEWLQRVWTHPINQFNKRLPELYLAYSLNGELILPVAINPIDGMPRWGYLDPMQIQKVQMLPDNVLVADTLVLKATNGSMTPTTLQIVRRDPATSAWLGDVFYHRTNTLPNSSRGRSDLLAVADWLDLYDQYQFAGLEGLKAASAYIWDVTVESNSQAEIDAERKKIENASSGMVYAHNKAKSIDAVTPKIGGADRAEASKMIAIHIAGSVGFPITWLGFDSSNRATVEGQNDVLLKSPSRRQKDFASVVTDLMQFALDGAVTRNPVLFSGVTDFSFAIEMPEIAAKDVARVGAVFATIITALDVAQSNGTMSRKAAIELTCAVVGQLGVKLDPSILEQEIDDEMAQKQSDDDAKMVAVKNQRTQPSAPAADTPDLIHA